jgi:IS5 family transposase
MGKGKAHRPYEFGAKVSLATALARSKGDRLFAHVKTLPGNPYDRHTLETVIPEIEAPIGANLSRIVADRGYRGHNVPPDHKMKVYISGLKRGVTEVIKRDRRRRSAVESVRAPLRPQLPQRRPWRRRQRRARRRRLQLVWGIVCQARFIKSVLLSSSFSPR